MSAPYSDPRDYGADCDHCVMRRWRVEGTIPVPAWIGPRARVAIVGMEPGEEETIELRPFVGPSGRILDEFGLAPAGFARDECAIVNVRDCRPPNNKYGLIEARLRKVNAARIAEGRDPFPTPTQCCRPRLASILAGYDCIVPLGSDALRAVLDTRAGILENRGAMFETSTFGRRALVLPTYHPMYVGRNMRWSWAFRQDFRRAARYFSGALQWEEPRAIYMPTIAQIRAFLDSGRDRLVYDVETDGIEPLTARLRCVGIGDTVGGIVIPWLSKDGFTRFYTADQYAEIADILRGFFTNPRIKKIGHNVNSYDRMVIEQHFGVTPAPVIDTLILHRLGAFAEFQHTLGFVGSTLTDVRAWKAGRIATNPETDAELWRYNLTDCVVNARIAEPCAEQVRRTNQIGVAKIDAQIQGICCGMHRLGEYVDQGSDRAGKIRPWPMKKDKETGKMVRDEARFGRAHWEVKLTEEKAAALAELRGLLGDPNFDPGDDEADYIDENGIMSDDFEAIQSFNPVSPKQLRELLYDRFRLPVLETTKESGDASTGDSCLRALIVDSATPEYPRRVLKAVRRVRQKGKLLGLVRSLRDDVGGKGCILGWDHMIHAHWNASGKGSGDDGSAVSGRLTSSPNLQNWRKLLRSMLVADPEAVFYEDQNPEFVFVDADMDALESRYLVGLAGCKKYQEVFDRARKLPPNHPDGDPHRTTMIMVHGEAAVRAFSGQPIFINGEWTKGSADYAKSRDLNKRIYYAGQYGADAPTVHDVILAATNKRGELLYTDLPLRRTRRMLMQWRKSVPEIIAWWYTQMDLFAAQGYLEEQIAGRRRYFLDGAQPKASGIDSHLINFPVQCVPGWTRVITDRGYLPIAELEGASFSAWTGKRWAPAVGVRKGTAALFRVRTNRGADFYCDATHRFYVVGRDGYEWRRADELGPNTRIALPLAQGLEFGAEGDEESAYMVGLWTADGSTSESSKSEKVLSFAVRAEDRDDVRGGRVLIDRISAWMESAGMQGAEEPREGVVNMRAYTGGAAWLLSWGADPGWKAHTKRIPVLIWRSSLATRRAFLRGFLDGDGFHEADGAATVNLCQRELCAELVLLARTVGIDGRVAGPYDTGDGEHICYRAVFSGAMAWDALRWGAPAKLHTATAPWREAARVLPDLSPITRSDRVIVSRIRCGRKQTASPYVLARMGGRDLFDHAVVTSVTPRSVVVPVYTLIVDDPDHAYVAGGIISHNSGCAGIVNNSTIRIVAAVPFDYHEGSGLVGQYHDALKLRVRARDAREVGEVLRREMSGEWLPGMLFTASPAIGLRGSQV